MGDTVRAVLVGCGGMSAAWLNAVRNIGGIEMVGFVDLDEEAAAKRRDEYGWTSVATGTDLASLLSAVSADCVFDCTIPDAHYGITMTALSRGLHVLGEKPLADTMAHAREMVDAAAKARKIFAVIQNRRYMPIIRRYRDLVQSGAIGEITTVNSDFYIGAHFGGFRDRMKHVLLLDMAIHTFDQARLISGSDASKVFCKEWNPAGSWYDHDASAIAIFTMKNGAVYTYRGSWCSEGLNTSWECEWRVIGSRGSAIWDGREGIRASAASEEDGFIRPQADVSVPDLRETTKEGGHQGLLREFVAAIRTGQVPETAASDNIKSLAMVFAAIESAEAGREVEVQA
ncbi:MAG: Gfo/Idh/MocA family oxidoreductase [Capsulimonadaceae bacterium]|nr:Gfo/Idh/MocA family oxidoreductase [Capsulimonadaceae bacterium]